MGIGRERPKENTASMEKRKQGRAERFSLFLLILLFWGVFALLGPEVYNDSNQYITMHIHREPLYPLFLAALRALYGENWMRAAGVLQCALAAVSVWVFARWLRRRFALSWRWEAAFALLGAAPYAVTYFFSALHIYMPGAIMSEALCLPLFTVFMVVCFRLAAGERNKGECLWFVPAFAAAALALVLSLIRSQMMWTFVLWWLIVCARVWRGRNTGARRACLARRLVLTLLSLCLAVSLFSARLLLVKTYNLIFNGHFINNTYGEVNTLTNILYASDRADGERITDSEARAFFYVMYDKADALGATYRHAGSSPRERADHLEQWHDTIKFQIIEDTFYQTYDATVTTDYITQNLLADETAGKIIAGILPACLGRWLADCALLMARGLVRTIAVAHPLVSPLAAALYLLSAALALRLWRRSGRANAVLAVYAVSLLAVLGNAACVSLTIICLSRYMVYGFAPFYAAGLLLLRENIKMTKRAEDENKR